MTLTYLLQKEFTQIRRNKFLPKLIIMFPIVIMCVMPWVMNQEVRNIRVDVVDSDHSVLSQRIMHQIEASDYLILNGRKASYADAIRDVETSRADVILVIPPHYGRNMATLAATQGQATATPHTPALIAAHAADPMKGSMGANYLTQILAGQQPASTARAATTGHAGRNPSVKVLNLYNKNLNYKVFMIPALMGILVMLFCGFLPTLNIVGEKERGTIEQINVTPVRKVTFILAKLIPYFIIALLVMTMCFILSWAIYGITCQGPLLLVYLLSILLAMTLSGMGLTISNYSDNMQQAVFVMWFIIVCIMLLSGIFTPVGSMPEWTQYIVAANPMHHYIDAVRTVFVRGGTISSIWPQVIILLGFAVATNTWAIASYKKNH